MGNQNSRINPQGEKGDKQDDIANMKFENVVSYVAAKYITQANFKDLENLHKPDYCPIKLVNAIPYNWWWNLFNTYF